MELTVATPSWDMVRPYLQGASPPKVDMASLGRRDRLLAAKDLVFLCVLVFMITALIGASLSKHTGKSPT